MVCSFAWLALFFRHRVCNAVVLLQIGLSVSDGVPRIILRIVFVIGAIVSDPADHFFGVVTAR